MVLHVVQSGDVGGVQRHIRDLVVGLPDLTAGVVTGTSGWMVDRVATAGIPTCLAPSLRRTLDPTSIAAAHGQVQRAVDTLGARVIHAHGIFALLAAATLRRVTLVYTAHGFQWQDPAHPAWLRSLARHVHHFVAPRLAALIAVSEQDAADALLTGIPPARIHHIPNGVRLPPASTRGSPPRALGTAGRLAASKNAEGLLSLLTLLPHDVALHVAGEGPSLPELRSLADTRGLHTRVRWLGWRDDLDDFYQGIGVYATLSRKEGLPYTVLDAMAHGRPVVASAIPAHQELLRGQPWGLLISDGNLASGVEGVTRWLSDTDAWRQAAAAARRVVAERYRLDTMLRLTAAVYRSAVLTRSMTGD